MCPVCSATFTRPQHVARHMRSHTGDRPYGCQMCGDRFARSDLLSRHVNKCHTPGGLANTTSRKGQGSTKAQAAAAEDKKRRPCEACTLQSTKCDFGKPCNNCATRGSKCAYAKAKRPRRNTNPSPSTRPGTLPQSVVQTQESMPLNSFGYQEDMTPFNFNYPAQDSSLAMPHLYEPSLAVPGANAGAFLGSPEAPSLSFSAATSDSNDSQWNGVDFMGMNNAPNTGFDVNTMFPDPNAPSFSSVHKLQQNTHPFNYGIDPQEPPLTAMHQRSPSGVQRHQGAHQRHRSSPSLDSHPLLNNALLRAQAQQYPAITPTRLYMHRGSISTSDSGTDYDSSNGRPGTAGEYVDYPSPMSLTNSDGGSVGQGVGRALDDMSLHDPGSSSLLSMGPMMVPGIGMGTGLTPAVESPSRPSMTQRQSTFGDLRAFWNECMDDQGAAGNGHGTNDSRHSLTKMTSMPCLKTPLGDVDSTPRAAAQDPLSRLGQKTLPPLHTPRVVNHTDAKSLERYQHAVDARPAPSLQMAPKMKAAAAKQEDTDTKGKTDSSFSAPFPPGTAQADAWRSLMSGSSNSRGTGSYVADSGRPNYKRLPSQTLGPESAKRVNHGEGGEEGAVYTDDEEEEDYKQAQQEWHRRMSLPVGLGRSGGGRLFHPQPVPVPSPRVGRDGY